MPKARITQPELDFVYKPFVYYAGKQSAYSKGLNLRDGLLLYSRYGGECDKMISLRFTAFAAENVKVVISYHAAVTATDTPIARLQLIGSYDKIRINL